MRKALLSILILLSPVAFAQTDNTFYAKQFPGNDVGSKVAAAQAGCSATLNCLIVIDSSLASYPPGTMPGQCANCTWIDYRTPGVFPANAIQVYSIDGVYKVDGSHYATIQQAINACLSNAAVYLNSNNPASGGNQPMCFVDASVAPNVASRSFGGYDPEVYCPNGPGAGACQAFCSEGSGLAGCYQSEPPGSMCAPSSPATCTTIPLKVVFPASTYTNPIIETDTIVWESGSDYEGVATANTGNISAGTVIEALGGGTASISGGDPALVINQNPLMQANNTRMENISWVGNPKNFASGAVVTVQNGFQATCDNASGSEPFNGATPGNYQGLIEMTWQNVWWGGPGTQWAFTGSGIDLDCEQLQSVNAGLEQITFDHVTSYRENTSTAAALNIVGDVNLVTVTEGMYKPVGNADMTAATVFIGTYPGGTQVPYNLTFDKSALFLGGPLVFQLAGVSTLKIGTIHVESAVGGTTSFMTCGLSSLSGITSGVVVDGAQFQGVATASGTWLFNWNLCQGTASPRTLLVTHSNWALAVANVYEATPATSGNWPFAVFRENQPLGPSSPTTGLVPTLTVSGGTQAIAAYNLPLINLSAASLTTVTSISSSLASGETLTFRNIGTAAITFAAGSSFGTGTSSSIILQPKQTATWMVNDGTGGAPLGLASAWTDSFPASSVSGNCTGIVGTAGPYVMPFMGGQSSSGTCSMAPTAYVGMSFPVAVVLSDLTVRCDTSGLNSSSGVFSVVTQPSAHGSFAAPAGTLTLTFGTSAANSILQDLVHSVSLNPGDLWQLDFTSGGAGETLSYCSASVLVSYCGRGSC